MMMIAIRKGQETGKQGRVRAGELYQRQIDMDHPRGNRMEHPQQDFRRNNDDRFLLPPPMAMPSLSTGQGFYTVESLQGASFVPPPQIGPPPLPQFLPSVEPYFEDRSLSRAGGFHHITRGVPPPFDRDLYSPPSFAMPHPPPFPRPSPHFRSDPRSLGFREFIQRERVLERSRPPWAVRPHRLFNRKRPDMLRDQSQFRQQHKLKNQVPKKAILEGKALDPVSEGNVAGSSANLAKESSTAGGPGWCHVCQINCHTAESLKKHLAGKRHKKQLECEKGVEKPSDGVIEIRKPDEENKVQKDIVKTCNEEVEAQGNVLGITSLGNVEETETIVEMNEQVDLTVTAGTTETVVDQVEIVVNDVIGEGNDTIRAAAQNEGDVIVETTSSFLSGEATCGLGNLVSVEDGMTSKSELVVKETEKEKVDTAAINVANASAPVEIQIVGNTDYLKSCEKKEEDKDSSELQANTASTGNKRSSDDCADVNPLSKKLQSTVSLGAEGKNEPFRQLCEICHVTCTSKRMLETHLKTKRHAANLKKNADGTSLNSKQNQGGRPSGRLKKG